MDRERIDTWCERGIIALVLAALVFGPLATGAVRTLEFLVLQGLTVAALFLWLVRLWLKSRPQFLMPPLGWVVLAFLGYALVQYLRADIEYVARLEVIRVLVYASIFFIIVNNLHRQETVNLIGYALVFLAMGISFYACYQYFSGNSRVWHFENPFYRGRGTGTYINANHLAGFLEMVLPLALAYTIAGRMKPLLRILIGYSACAILAGIGVSLSRGGWLATGGALLGFVLMLTLHRGYRLIGASLLVVLVLAGAFVAPKFIKVQERAESVLREATDQEYSRYLLWRPALELWADNKITGVGPGHFDIRFRSVRPQEIQKRPDRAHNDYLNALADWGVIGLGLVLLALVVLGLGLRKAWRHVGSIAPDLGSRRSNRFAFVLGGLFGLVALAIHSVVDFNMQIPANAIVAVSLMALLATHLRFATDRYWFNAPRWVTALVSLALIAAIGALSYAGQRRVQEYVAWERADRADDYSNAEIEALKRAFAAEPQNSETANRLGWCYRIQSWDGTDDYAALAEQAITWFSRATALNPYDADSYLWQGLCLDWLGRHEEARPLVMRAEELDPNGYYTIAHVGWHYVQSGQYAAARAYFERSLRLQWKNNPIAQNYLEICNRRLEDLAQDDELSRAVRSQTMQ